MGIPSGELDKYVEVKRLKEGLRTDGAGHIDETNEANWRVLCKRWVKLTPRGSREFFHGQQVAEDITHQVSMLFDSESATLKTEDKLVYGARQFNLNGPGMDLNERHEALVFAAIEVK